MFVFSGLFADPFENWTGFVIGLIEPRNDLLSAYFASIPIMYYLKYIGKLFQRDWKSLPEVTLRSHRLQRESGAAKEILPYLGNNAIKRSRLTSVSTLKANIARVSNAIAKRVCSGCCFRLTLAAVIGNGYGVNDFVGNAYMRTNIVIDDKLMLATLKATGIKTKREAVERGLRALLRLTQQTELRKLRGKYEWDGDLDAMRRNK